MAKKHAEKHLLQPRSVIGMGGFKVALYEPIAVYFDQLIRIDCRPDPIEKVNTVTGNTSRCHGLSVYPV